MTSMKTQTAYLRHAAGLPAETADQALIIMKTDEDQEPYVILTGRDLQQVKDILEPHLTGTFVYMLPESAPVEAHQAHGYMVMGSKENPNPDAHARLAELLAAHCVDVTVGQKPIANATCEQANTLSVQRHDNTDKRIKSFGLRTYDLGTETMSREMSPEMISAMHGFISASPTRLIHQGENPQELSDEQRLKLKQTANKIMQENMRDSSKKFPFLHQFKNES